MLPIVENIVIDPNATTYCPLLFIDRAIQFSSVSIGEECVICPGYQGLAEISSDKTLSWDKRYAVRCGGVVERRTKILRVG
ncbi:MAG: hypothetical protein OEY29_15775 [Gammaproteobacteria bacterium]|nr:hypothetical protein [Gammaproteobacteria bacterium]